MEYGQRRDNVGLMSYRMSVRPFLEAPARRPNIPCILQDIVPLGLLPKKEYTGYLAYV